MKPLLPYTFKESSFLASLSEKISEFILSEVEGFRMTTAKFVYNIHPNYKLPFTNYQLPITLIWQRSFSLHLFEEPA